MRRSSVAFLLIVLTLISPVSQSHAQHAAQDNGSMSNRITITIGEKEFAATLADNPTAEAFRKLLPLSITMSELNGNEKLFRLPANLPTQESVRHPFRRATSCCTAPAPWCCSTNRSRRPTATPE